MRITINEPDGRMSGIVLGETIDVNYDNYFRFKELDGRTGKETISVLQNILDKITTGEITDYEQLIVERISGILNTLLEMARKNPDGTWRVL